MEDTAPLVRAEFIDTGIATIEYQHLIVVGPESVLAAQGAECALEQGFFWEYHDILYQKQGAENAGVYSAANLKRYAREMADAWADLDPARSFDAKQFDDCLDSGRTRDTVEQQARAAAALLQAVGAQVSTPTFLINGRVVPGAQPIEVFRQEIERIRKALDAAGQ